MAPRKNILSKSKPAPGRPRSELSRAAILDAAYGFLETQPVSSISPLHIARKAGVSTATVYKWWPTKEALLLDAFLQKTERERTLTSTDPPLERVKQHVLQAGRFLSGKHGIVVARLLTAIQDNPVLRGEFLERLYSPRSSQLRAAVVDAIRAGQLPPKTNVSEFLDMILGPLIIRLLLRHKPIHESFVRLVFSRVVASTVIQARQKK